MKCVCIRKCQIPIGKRARLVSEGYVGEFDKCPPHFAIIGGAERELDFLTAGEAELLAATWKLEDAAKAVKAEFNVELEAGKKSDIVAQIIDARYRQVD